MSDVLKLGGQPRLVTAPPRRAYAGIANRILEQAREAGLGPGARLPPERQLAEELNVSRTTVREALAALEIVGAVETRVGAGTFVVASANFEWDAWAAEASPVETLEARLLIEPRLAQLAARRWDRKTLAAIKRTIDELNRLAKIRPPERPTTLDREFHAAIATAAGNSVLAAVVTPLRDLMSGAVWLASKDRPWTAELMQRLVHEHTRIFEAVRARDGERAAFEMETHLRRVQAEISAAR